MTALPAGSRGIGAARGFERAAFNLYPTDLPRALALVDIVEDWIGGLWECACGLGHLSKVLIGHGHDVVSTDLIARGYGQGGVDFLKTRTLRRPNIATNPPFDHWWLKFADHAVALGARRIALLGRLQLLEDFAGRADFFRRTRGWRAVYCGRSQMLPLGAVDRGDKGMIPVCWYVRDAHARNEFPEIRWHRARGSA
jgi:hypothetical protein